MGVLLSEVQDLKIKSQFCKKKKKIFKRVLTKQLESPGVNYGFLLPCLLACMLSIQSCLTLCNSMDCNPPGSSVHGDFPSKNTGVGCHALLQGIFLTQRSNPHLSHLCNSGQLHSLGLSFLTCKIKMIIVFESEHKNVKFETVPGEASIQLIFVF